MEEELGWRDKKCVIGAINGNCVMMALLQTLPTAARHFRRGCNGFCPLVLAGGETTQAVREDQDMRVFSVFCKVSVFRRLCAF